MRRPLTLTYFLIVAVHLVPIWSVTYLPTADGPSHLYNSWVIKELLTGDAPDLAKWYRIDWRPHPNWIGHAFLAVAMVIVPPLIAEKLLVSAIVIVFLMGVWMLAGAVDERCRPYAFLALPFTFNMLLQTGFYNFSLASGLCLMTIAIWWRRRREPTLRTILIVGTLLLLCYFSHALPLVLAMASIGVLWLATLSKTNLLRHARHLIAFVPVVLLLLWFAVQRGTTSIAEQRSAADLFEYLSKSGVMFSLDLRQFQLGRVLFIVIAILLAVSIIREATIERRFREEHAFFVVLIATAIVYFKTPSAIAGGLLLVERISLFVPLLAIPALSPNVPRAIRLGAAAVGVAAALINLAFATRYYADVDRRIGQYLGHLTPVTPGTTILPLKFGPSDSYINYYSHAVDYVAIDKRLIDFDNYQPGTDYFPLTWAPGVEWPDIGLIEGRPWELDPNAYAARANYLSVWNLLDGNPLEEQIEQRYRLVLREGRGRLYASEYTSPFRQEAMVLLPLAGTTEDIFSAAGGRWAVEQRVTNRGATPIYFATDACALTPSCDATLAPGESIQIAKADQAAQFALIRAERSLIRQLDFSTTLVRRDERGAGFEAEIPAIHENDFQRHTLSIPDVPVSPSSRLNLRMWLQNSSSPTKYSVNITTPDGRTYRSSSISTFGGQFVMDSHLLRHFPHLEGHTTTGTVRLMIENPTPNARLWAFITATDNMTDVPTFHMPR